MTSRKRQRPQAPSSPRAADPASPAPPSAGGRRIVGWRLWALRLAVAIAAPLVFLALAELVLRAAGYGYPAEFFVAGCGGTRYEANPKFGRRYFPHGLARAPDFALFDMPKPAGTYRIFVLGSSAAFGVPEPAYNFGRLLEVMLRERYPGVRFEVINATMTAINSHAVREIARECAGRDADLLIVYMGNNEVVGPYGPGTVFSRFSPNLGAIRAGLRAKSTRVGQLIGDAAQALAGGKTAASWQGMQMFLEHRVAADDPRLATAYDHFRANLADICSAARSAGPRAIVCTVVTNLRDCPPFASLHRADLPAPDLARWQEACDAGVALEKAGEPAKAAEKYAAASALDDRWADLHFRQARGAWALGRFDEAREHFVRARDLDALRFRADTRINEIIREAAAGREAQGVYLVDAAKAFESNPATPHGVPGGEWLYEHVHFTFQGNYLLARTILERAGPLLPEAIRQRAAGTGPPTVERCAELLALTGWNRLRLMQDMADMMSRPPFTNQIDHAEQAAEMRRRVRELAPQTSAAALLEAAQVCAKALERNPDDFHLQANLAVLESARGNHAAAAERWRAILARCPDHVPTIVALGLELMRGGRTDAAIEQFNEALRRAPDNASAQRDWGDALVLQKKPEEAIRHYQEALRLKPDFADARLNLATALVALGKEAEAAAEYEKALAIAPSPTGHYNLAVILARQGKTAEAIAHCRQALALEPDDPTLVDKLQKRLKYLEARQRQETP